MPRDVWSFLGDESHVLEKFAFCERAAIESRRNRCLSSPIGLSYACLIDKSRRELASASLIQVFASD